MCVRLAWSMVERVELEVIQGFTGHRTTAVVLKHHFRLGREDFRAVLAEALPKMSGLGNSKPIAKEEMKRILERSTNWIWSV